MLENGNVDADLGVMCPITNASNIKEEPTDENTPKVKEALADMKLAYLISHVANLANQNQETQDA